MCHTDILAWFSIVKQLCVMLGMVMARLVNPTLAKSTVHDTAKPVRSRLRS